jgi:hypothetical protein
MAQIPSRTIAKLHICASVGFYDRNLHLYYNNISLSGFYFEPRHLKIRISPVYLLSIYDKSELDDIPDKELEALLRFIP